jgi:hypothetical protein
MADDDDSISNIRPEDFELPKTHVVQALEDGYIHPSILTEALDKAFPNNWTMVVSSAPFLRNPLAEVGAC